MGLRAVTDGGGADLAGAFEVEEQAVVAVWTDGSSTRLRLPPLALLVPPSRFAKSIPGAAFPVPSLSRLAQSRKQPSIKPAEMALPACWTFLRIVTPARCFQPDEMPRP